MDSFIEFEARMRGRSLCDESHGGTKEKYFLKSRSPLKTGDLCQSRHDLFLFAGNICRRDTHSNWFITSQMPLCRFTSLRRLLRRETVEKIDLELPHLTEKLKAIVNFVFPNWKRRVSLSSQDVIKFLGISGLKYPGNLVPLMQNAYPMICQKNFDLRRAKRLGRIEKRHPEGIVLQFWKSVKENEAT